MAPNLSSQLIVLLLLAATASATKEEEMITEYKKCVEEMQKYPLTVCHSFLKYGISGAGNPTECCEQLRRVSDTCCCELLNMMTGEMMMKEMEDGQCHGQCEEIRMRGAFLPLMCAVGPPCPLSYGRRAAAGSY